jgi:3-oxoacyl-[acyl-carrier-protein] synthase II
MGLVTPIGNDLDTFWKNVVGGVSGIGPITQFDCSAYGTRFAGEVRGFDPALYFREKKDARRADRFIQLAVAASKDAMHHAGFANGYSGDVTRFGVMVGSGIGGLHTTEEQHSILMEKGPSRVSPFMIPMLIANMASGIVSMEHGLQGPNFAPVSACSTAAHAIGEAWRMIRFGDADLFLAGGTESAIVPLGMAGFGAMKALSTRNDDPTRASRPFDKDRDGFVMGEGAGVIVLELLDSALARGTRIHGEIVGYGLTSDAYHISAPLPDGGGAVRCMQMALRTAGISPEQVDYINAHGTSTPIGDVCETQAVKKVFGERAKSGLLVSSTKSVTGHLLGAAGAVESIVCAKAITDGIVPPTMNLDEPSPECDLDYVPNCARKADIRYALNNSFGFGGHNATLIIKRFEP